MITKHYQVRYAYTTTRCPPLPLPPHRKVDALLQQLDMAMCNYPEGSGGVHEIGSPSNFKNAYTNTLCPPLPLNPLHRRVDALLQQPTQITLHADPRC